MESAQIVSSGGGCVRATIDYWIGSFQTIVRYRVILILFYRVLHCLFLLLRQWCRLLVIFAFPSDHCRLPAPSVVVVVGCVIECLCCPIVLHTGWFELVGAIGLLVTRNSFINH